MSPISAEGASMIEREPKFNSTAFRTRESQITPEMVAPVVAVVIPTYKVREHILEVISQIGPTVARIYVVDDCCPEQSGIHVRSHCKDDRVIVIFNEQNRGVGGATISGYKQALSDGADIVVKLDGDGQMDPKLIDSLIKPLTIGIADYTKGNRFFALENLDGMPPARLIGNAILSFVSKAASGYWNVMDPTNGFTAIHKTALGLLALQKIDHRYFFESDMLFRLNTIRAVVQEMPMKAKYGSEQSSLRIGKVLIDFPRKYLSRFFKRLFYNYVLRDFNVCSVELIAGVLFLAFGGAFGIYKWYESAMLNVAAPTGTIMLAVLPVIIGVQMILAAITLDVMNVPKEPLQGLLD